MKKYSVWVVLVAVLTIVGLEACQSTKNASASKMLKFDLQQGKGYDYEMTVNMDQQIMGQSIQMDLVYYYSMNVEGEEAGIKTISSSMDRLKFSTSVAGFNLDVDTDKPYKGSDTSAIGKSLGAVNRVFAALKGEKFTMKVNQEGKVLSVSGLEDLPKKFADSLMLNDEERAEMMKEFEGQFSSKEFAQNLERYIYIFPNKDVKVGDSWEKNSDMGGRMPGKYKSTYTVKEIEGDMVTLEEKSKVQAKEDGEMNMDGDITGTLVVDSKSGLVVDGEQDMTFKVKVEGMSFDMKAKSKIKGKAR